MHILPCERADGAVVLSYPEISSHSPQQDRHTCAEQSNRVTSLSETGASYLLVSMHLGVLLQYNRIAKGLSTFRVFASIHFVDVRVSRDSFFEWAPLFFGYDRTADSHSWIERDLPLTHWCTTTSPA